MVKELWTLVKMLFTARPDKTDGVKVIDMKHFPFKGYKAMCWCGTVIHREGASEVNDITVNHENIHLMQAAVCGSWIRYYIIYLREWLKGNPIIKPASSAYMTIPFECEAYANETDFGYCEGYDGKSLKKYTFENRKKLYKELGGTSAAWKAYVKTL